MSAIEIGIFNQRSGGNIAECGHCRTPKFIGKSVGKVKAAVTTHYRYNHPQEFKRLKFQHYNQNYD